jgi:sugar/nucleoside kinase (ribokinase family)
VTAAEGESPVGRVRSHTSDPVSGRSGVVCVGSVIVDLGKVIDSYPALDHLATIEEVSVSTGGPALNMAVDLRQLGAGFPVAMIGAVGDDEHGRYVLGECARLGIDTSGIQTLDGVATAFTDAMVERGSGRRTFFVHNGASGVFDAATADIEGAPARILHAGAPGLHATLDAHSPDGNGWTELLRRAQAAGMHTNMELVDLEQEHQVELSSPCLPFLDSIIINELEAGALTGLDAPAPDADGAVDWDTLEEMTIRLLERGVSTLAVVHFPAGCVAASADGRTWRQGSVLVPQEHIRSTTGAGDAFAAGVLFGIHEGWPVEECLRLGSASAGASIRSPHTSAGIDTVAACLAAAATRGYRSP